VSGCYLNQNEVVVVCVSGSVQQEKERFVRLRGGAAVRNAAFHGFGRF